MAADPAQEQRKRSIENLQRLYAIVAGLSLTTAVTSLLTLTPPAPSEPVLQFGATYLRLNSLPMFLSFAVTLLAFYHGTHRHLDLAYVFRPAAQTTKTLAPIVDFLFAFLQAILFYAMALVLADGFSFYSIFIALMVKDIPWFGYIHFTDVMTLRVGWLLGVNTTTAVLLLLILAYLPDHAVKWWVAAIVVVARSLVDYVVNWSIFWSP